MTLLAQRDGVRVVAFQKCGHTSIINTFLQRREGFVNPEPAVITQTNWAHDGVRGYPEQAVDWPEPRLLIAVIRSPLRRALSAYMHFMQRKERDNLTRLGFKFGCGLNQYVNHLKTVDLREDQHIAPYAFDVVDATNDKYPTIVIPLELIDVMWPIVIAKEGLYDVPLKPWHKNPGHYNYEDVMTPYAESVLSEIYSKDCNLWEAVYDEARTAIPAVRYKTPQELIHLANKRFIPCGNP